MKLVLYLFCSIVLLSIVLAEERYSYQTGSFVEIREPCYYNSSVCPTDTLCNITVNYPNNSVYVVNSPMSRNYTDYNYSLGYVNKPGLYPIKVVCCYGLMCDNDNYEISVKASSWRDVSPYAIIVGLGIIAAGCILIAIFLSSEHIILQSYFYLIALLIMFIGIPSTFISDNIVFRMWKIGNYLFIITLLYVLLYTVYYLIATRVMKNKTKQSEDEYED